jgi:hypothetical protein
MPGGIMRICCGFYLHPAGKVLRRGHFILRIDGTAVLVDQARQ